MNDSSWVDNGDWDDWEDDWSITETGLDDEDWGDWDWNDEDWGDWDWNDEDWETEKMTGLITETGIGTMKTGVTGLE